MSRQSAPALLAAEDPPPYGIINPGGTSSFLLIGDHAGNAIPAGLDGLGLDRGELDRHIGIDIGIHALGTALAEILDATFIAQTYSRLVADCNRAPSAIDAVAEISDGTVITGNRGLADAVRHARITAIHEPYHAAIGAELDRRDQAGKATILVALHSFTPRMNDFDRPWQVGVLYDGGDRSFALDALAALRRRGELVVGDNEPYAMDGIDYTIPRHAYPKARPYVEFEVRQDLLGTEEGVDQWARLLADVLIESVASRT